MKQFLITVAGVLVGLILFLILAPLALVGLVAGAGGGARSASPASVVLEIDLRQDIPDQPPAGPFALFGHYTSTVELVRKLEAAARDPKVKGVYLRAASAGGLDPAQFEEVRSALAGVQDAKKFVIAHIQNDSGQASLAGYAAIAGADQVWLQETSEFMPMGLYYETDFYGGAFEKFRVVPQFEQRDEYKNAVNQLTQKGFTPAHREASASMIESVFAAAVADVAADRDLTPAAARAAIEGTPYTAKQALERKLVDKLGRPEDAEAEALSRAGEGAELLPINAYSPAFKGGPVIALVTGEGAIETGPSSEAAFSSDPVMNSDAIAQALLDAAADPEVKAIVFRVSSPGGSAVASDQILHAVKTAKTQGKKVVVSMGPYAASGGYYVSAAADAIVASPTTITGSIGIYGGKFVIGDALSHYAGVTTDAVQTGSPMIAAGTSARRFSAAERAAFAQWIDRGYGNFLSVVGEGRKMTAEQVRAVAKGRVWTGIQAKERGLVDELGGLSTAVARAKALAGIDAGEAVTLKLFPLEKSPFEAIQELFGVSGEAARAAAALGAVLGEERLSHALRIASQNGGARAEAELGRVR